MRYVHRAWLVLTLGLGAASWTAGSEVLAAEIPQSLRSWLMALESVPSAEQLRRAGGDKTEALLDAVVRDAGEASYPRHRALSLLSLLDSKAATETLRKHLTIRDDALRATAAVAWASGPARRAPQQAMAEMNRLLADRSPQVRAAAARALALTGDAAGSRQRAVQRRAKETVPEVQRALDRAVQQIDAKNQRQ